MAKMFYSLEETAQKLGVSEDQVKQMAGSGELQQFRDRDKIMFKCEEVDAMAPGEPLELLNLDFNTDDPLGTDNTIPLVDNQPPPELPRPATTDTDVIDLITTDTTMPGSAGLSNLDDIDIPTQPASTPAGASGKQPSSGDDDEELLLETVGSGSGLLDLTRETDDTSLGIDMLDDLYSPATGSGAVNTQSSTSSLDATTSVDTAGIMNTADTTESLDSSDTAITSSSIFEGPTEIDISASGLENLQEMGEPSATIPSESMGIPMAMEPVVLDYTGNGLSIGVLLVAAVCLFLATATMLYAIAGVPSSTTASLAQYPTAFAFGMLAATAVLGLGGMMFGKSFKR